MSKLFQSGSRGPQLLFQAARTCRAAGPVFLALLVVLGWPSAASAQCNWTPGTPITETCGSVGIGTTTVNANEMVRIVQSGSGSINLRLQNASGGNMLQLSDGVSYVNYFGIDPTNRFGWIGESAGSGIVMKQGNVGIGQTSPGAKLDVNGVALFEAGFNVGAAATNAYNNITGSFTGLSTAIGLRLAPILTPVTGNDVYGITIALTAGSSTENIVNAIDYRAVNPTKGNSGTLTNAIGFKVENFTTAATNDYGIYVVAPTGGSSVNAGAQIDGNVYLTPTTGNVGIGTTAPTAKLHVVGDVIVTGNIAAKYQDLAEWVPARQRLGVGTVVIVDSESRNGVVPSAEAYDTRVAGVISAKPGMLLGEGGEGQVMVAAAGRVKVKVDATREAVRAGDLLVTSDHEGYAMRSEPVNMGGIAMHRPGTLIGKALEPMEKGKQGEILVLLSLQ